jgi:hypothetical protein
VTDRDARAPAMKPTPKNCWKHGSALRNDARY